MRAKLVARVDLDVSTVLRVEKGRDFPSMTRPLLLAAALQLEVEVQLGGSVPPSVR
jgi:transcriptional regulator with XRE-family HTH domain